MTINLNKIIELKRILNEKFDIELQIYDSDNGQTFSIKKPSPAGIEYIKLFFEKINYKTVFNEDMTEFYVEEIRVC